MKNIYNEQLSQDQLRTVLDSIYDGVPATTDPIFFMRQFPECHRMMLWLVRNNLKGMSLVNFFTEHGRLGACQIIINKLEGNKYTPRKLDLCDLYRG